MFVEQIEGLKDGGADVIWIETMSALEEMHAAAAAAAKAGMPYTVTGSFISEFTLDVATSSVQLVISQVGSSPPVVLPAGAKVVTPG